LKSLGIAEDDETIMDYYCESVCDICNREIVKNLSPQNPVCEGAWCDEAIDLWLDEEAEEDEGE